MAKKTIDLEKLPFFPSQKVWVFDKDDLDGFCPGKIVDITAKLSRVGSENKIQTIVKARYRLRPKRNSDSWSRYSSSTSRTLNLTVAQALDQLLIDENSLDGERVKLDISKMRKSVKAKESSIKNLKFDCENRVAKLQKDIDELKLDISRKSGNKKTGSNKKKAAKEEDVKLPSKKMRLLDI